MIASDARIWALGGGVPVVRACGCGADGFRIDRLVQLPLLVQLQWMGDLVDGGDH